MGGFSRSNVGICGSNQGGQLFLLEFENVGGSPAEDVRAYINKPLHQQLGQTVLVTDAPFFNGGLRALPARRPIKFALGVAFRWLSDTTDRALHPSIFDVTVTYKTLGREIIELFPIDMERQFSLSAVDKDYVEEFARTFPEKFERSMRDLNQSVKTASEPVKEPPSRKSWSKRFAEQVSANRRWRSY